MKKGVSPKQKNRAVKDAAEKGLCSFWRLYAYLSLSASVGQRSAISPSSPVEKLSDWPNGGDFVQGTPRYGYRCIYALLVKESWITNRKLVQPLRRSEGLQVKPSKKRRPRQGVSTRPPTKAIGRNHVWSWDFIHDRTDYGGPLKRMTLIDYERDLVMPYKLFINNNLYFPLIS